MTGIIVGAARLAARVTASFAVAFTVGTLGHQLPAHAATLASAATPVQEPAACSAAYHFHHVNAVPALYADEALWQAAYRAAWQAARHAGPEMRADIDRWLFTDHGWSLVRHDCNPDEGL